MPSVKQDLVGALVRGVECQNVFGPSNYAIISYAKFHTDQASRPQFLNAWGGGGVAHYRKIRLARDPSDDIKEIVYEDRRIVWKAAKVGEA